MSASVTFFLRKVTVILAAEALKRIFSTPEPFFLAVALSLRFASTSSSSAVVVR